MSRPQISNRNSEHLFHENIFTCSNDLHGRFDGNWLGEIGTRMKEDQLLSRWLSFEADQCLFESVELLQVSAFQTFVNVIFAGSNVNTKSLKLDKFD